MHGDESEAIVTHRGGAAKPAQGNAGEVFVAFLRLGLTSFGGPIAHLGYFRDEVVTRRKWLPDRDYAELVALTQFLPGPTSSQVGFALGLRRAGPLGALAAWAAFTLPSAVLLVAFAYGATAIDGVAGAGALAGLKIVAVAVVAHAVWAMARTLTPDARRVGIAVVALAIALLWGGLLGLLAAIVIGAGLGFALCRGTVEDLSEAMSLRISRRVGIGALALFAGLLVGLPLVAAASDIHVVRVADAFYRAGALVFGGGHVVLPLLAAETVPQWVSSQQFLSGYAAAQAVPGPLFTFAAYLGASSAPGAAGLAAGAVALVAVFLPGMLLLIGALPFWNIVRSRPSARAAMRGANAAVVGILAAALYDPVFITAIVDPASFGLAFVCFALLVWVRVPPWAVVAVGAAAGVLLAL